MRRRGVVCDNYLARTRERLCALSLRRALRVSDYV
jgi:hypothetical protein